jgi:transposase
MRKIREVLRLFWTGNLSQSKIAQSCGISRHAVSEYINRAKISGLSWSLPEELDDSALELLLFPSEPRIKNRPAPDWSDIHQQMHRKGVTLQLLWIEYKQSNPKGYQYTQFCHYYQQWLRKLDLTMRQTHNAGEKMYVDFAGQTVPIVDATTGEVKQAQIFVAVLAASNYTFAKAKFNQDTPAWLQLHADAFEYFGGVPEVIIPDNLKAGVSRPCKWEPDINPAYQDLAIHYGTAIMPARVRKPKDKAKVEVAVQIVERWILAALRKRKFFSIAELNSEIKKLLEILNSRPFKKLPGCRRSLFESIDKPKLKQLPAERYEYADWRKAKVNIDYHIEIHGHYYSVPYQLAHQYVDVRITANAVECFFRNRRISSHVRSDNRGQHSTLPEHMPKAHRQYGDWNADKLIGWASDIGPNTKKITEAILQSRRYPQQGYRSCLGILRLAKAYDKERLEAACNRCYEMGALSYKSVESTLKHHLELKPLIAEPMQQTIFHLNIRGADYYKEIEDVKPPNN